MFLIVHLLLWVFCFVSSHCFNILYISSLNWRQVWSKRFHRVHWLCFTLRPIGGIFYIGITKTLTPRVNKSGKIGARMVSSQYYLWACNLFNSFDVIIQRGSSTVRTLSWMNSWQKQNTVYNLHYCIKTDENRCIGNKNSQIRFVEKNSIITRIY